jgi:uncharacterized protein YjdB
MLRMSKALFTGTVVLALLAACGESAVTGTNSVATVELSAPATTVRAGGTLSLSVRLKDLSGNPLDNVAVFWSSSDPKIAIVSNSGVVSATAAGVVTIAASALGKSATTAITVTDRDVATVQITPATVSVRIASSVPLTARALDSEGNTLQRTLSWTTSDASVAIVSAAGVVSGVAPGAATITATSDGRSGTAAVTVSVNPVATVAVSPARDTIGVGAETSLTATLRDAAGTVVTGRSLAWSASDVQVATVSSTGVVTALAPGIVTITAASEGRIGTSSIVVLARLASTVTLTPGNPTVLIGSTVQLLAQITDGSGNILNGRPITFVSDNGAVATVDATGMIRGISVGTAKVTATSEGKIGTATITVAPLPVATVNVTPPTATIFIGATAQLGAQALSASGTALTGRTVTWIAGAPSVATVSVTGVVTAISPGTVLIVAVIDGVSGTAMVTVRAHPVATVTITPTTPAVLVAGSTQLTAALRDDTGAALTGRPVTWSSADESIAFVSSSGLVIGIKAGTTKISAISEGVIGTTVITVR